MLSHCNAAIRKKRPVTAHPALGSGGVESTLGAIGEGDTLTPGSSCNFIVTVRVRPLSSSERGKSINGSTNASVASVSSDDMSTGRCTIQVEDEKVLSFEPGLGRQLKYRKKSYRSVGAKTQAQTASSQPSSSSLYYTFDRVFGPEASQVQVYEGTCKSLVKGVLNGINGTVFAYGATGAGKTHTMSGNVNSPGIMALTLTDLFEALENARQSDCSLAVNIELGYLEIYNEKIRDLLPSTNANNSNIYLDGIREDEGAKEIIVPGLSLHSPKTLEQVMELLDRGNANRTMCGTLANATSSRSHAVLLIRVEQKSTSLGESSGVDAGNIVTYTQVKRATLTLIDLAGSERASATSNRGDRMREGANINRSLLALGNCINALCRSSTNNNKASPASSSHIPYRDSKLTRILKYSLGGNCMTVMIAAVSPFVQHFEDTYNTLVYANRAKNIKTRVSVNGETQLDQRIGQYVKVINQLCQEVESLKEKLKAQEEGQKEIDESANELTLQRARSDSLTIGLQDTAADLSAQIMSLETLVEALNTLLLLCPESEANCSDAVNRQIAKSNVKRVITRVQDSIEQLQGDLLAVYSDIDAIRSSSSSSSDTLSSSSSSSSSSSLTQVLKVVDLQRCWIKQLANYAAAGGNSQCMVDSWIPLYTSFMCSEYVTPYGNDLMALQKEDDCMEGDSGVTDEKKENALSVNSSLPNLSPPEEKAKSSSSDSIVPIDNNSSSNSSIYYSPREGSITPTNGSMSNLFSKFLAESPRLSHPTNRLFAKSAPELTKLSLNSILLESSPIKRSDFNLPNPIVETTNITNESIESDIKESINTIESDNNNALPFLQERIFNNARASPIPTARVIHCFSPPQAHHSNSLLKQNVHPISSQSIHNFETSSFSSLPIRTNISTTSISNQSHSEDPSSSSNFKKSLKRGGPLSLKLAAAEPQKGLLELLENHQNHFFE